MSVTLVDAPETMAASRPRLDALLGGFEFKKGETYAEWRPGDKVAEYGLTALVAAGAGAAAAKLGFFAVVGKFLAKGWKLLVLALAGLGGVIGKLWRKVRGVPEEARPTAAAAQVLPPPAPPSERSSGPGFGEGGPGGAPDA
jgi:uncharacterized membrane-anchored protein